MALFDIADRLIYSVGPQTEHTANFHKYRMNYGAQVVQTTTSQPTVFTAKYLSSSVETRGVAHKQHAHIPSTHQPVPVSTP